MALLPRLLSADKVLSLVVINGHNIWKTNLSAVLDWIEPLAARHASPRLNNPVGSICRRQD